MSKKIFHVLVVVDDDKIRELEIEYLEQKQFLVTTARDALHAKKKIGNYKIRYNYLRYYDAWTKWFIFN